MVTPVLTGFRILESKKKIVLALYGLDLDGANLELNVRIYPGRPPHDQRVLPKGKLKVKTTKDAGVLTAVIDRSTAVAEIPQLPDNNAPNQPLARDLVAFAGEGTGDFTTTIDLVDDNGPPSNEIAIHWDDKILAAII